MWRRLYKGILESGGDNTYSRHTGSRRSHRRSSAAGEQHDQSYPVASMERATKVRDDLAAVLEGTASLSADSKEDSPFSDD